MDDNSQMPFGKHAGEKMANVPADYLLWLWNKGIVSIKNWNRVYWYIHDNLDSLKNEVKSKESFKQPQFT